MNLFAVVLTLVLSGAPAAAEPAGEIVPSGPGSAYATARATCAKQGRKLEMLSTQTNDKYTQVAVTVSYRCGARLARPVRKR